MVTYSVSKFWREVLTQIDTLLLERETFRYLRTQNRSQRHSIRAARPLGRVALL